MLKPRSSLRWLVLLVVAGVVIAYLHSGQSSPGAAMPAASQTSHSEPLALPQAARLVVQRISQDKTLLSDMEQTAASPYVPSAAAPMPANSTAALDGEALIAGLFFGVGRESRLVPRPASWEPAAAATVNSFISALRRVDPGVFVTAHVELRSGDPTRVSLEMERLSSLLLHAYSTVFGRTFQQALSHPQDMSNGECVFVFDVFAVGEAVFAGAAIYFVAVVFGDQNISPEVDLEYLQRNLNTYLDAQVNTALHVNTSFNTDLEVCGPTCTRRGSAASMSAEQSVARLTRRLAAGQ